MKKLNRLFAILIAVLGISATAKADTSILNESDGWQKITSLPSNLGDYYFALVDKNNDLMLTMAPGANQGSNYYTMYYRKSANPLQHRASLWTIEGSNYTFRNVEYTKFAMQTEWNAAWYYRTHDQPNACEWTATTPVYSLQEACWTIQNGKYPNSGYLGPWDDASFTDGAEVAFNKSGNNVGKFHIYAILKTHCKDVATNATQGNPVDMSVLMTNSDAALAVIGLSGWTTANTIVRNGNNGYDGKSGFFEFCNWGGNYWEGSITQTISSLPNGKYKVRATGQASEKDVELTLTANGVSTSLNCIGDKGGNISADGSVVASGSGVAGWQYMEVECVVVNGELTISAYSKGTAQYRWANIDNFSFYYCGKDLTTYEKALSSKITTAKAIDNDKLNTYVKDYLANEITAAENALKDASRTVESLETRAGELDKAITLANETTAPYANFKSLMTLCESTLSNSAEFEAGAANAFTTAINTAKNNVASATTAGDINAAYNTLEEERRVYIKKADPLNGELFDYTFMIVNPGFDNGTNGWNCESNAQNKNTATNKTNGIITGAFFENWNPSNFSGTISQSISGLPSGKYLLKVAAFGAGANVFANNEQTAVNGSDGEWYEVEVAVSEGALTFGIKNENATNWIGIDNASLYYKGFDVETAKTGITSLISQAEALATKPMNKDVLAGLNETIGKAEEILKVDYPTRKELNTMMEELNQAMDDVKAPIADYEKIDSYINMTAKFTDVSAYQQKYDDGLFTNDEVESVRQELNVIRFTAASTDFANDIEVTGWTGSMGGKNTGGQHWDGTTGENATKYYDNNSWGGASHSTTTSITLPKGTYVLKAALRSHEKTTMTLTVLDQVVNVNGKGDTGYGIDTEGKANFSEDGDYANEDKGRGWEWEFVKFQLTEETEVTLKVECNYNGEFGWASFSDITLWMDDATYITVNSNVIKASLATAQALVNTQPMGTNENTALMTAIAQAEKTFSTPDELDNALEALNAAIAEANAWVSKYNEGKTLLVAALERFESEFNDGENGALRFIPEQNWKNILNAVMVVAEAKDKLDDYSNFAQAANKLHAAMDAVFAIYNEYKMLEDNTELIKNADCTSNDSWEGNGRTTYNDQHWSGTTRTYFTQNHENGAARSQTITLPKTGSYLLKVAVRAVEATSYVEFLINGTSYKTKGAHGHIGGTIATDGTEWENVETGIKAGKTFANDNKGFGWVYTYIYFNAKAGDNTIAINLSNCNSGREANCGGMELYYLRPNYVVEEENIVKHYGKFAEAINAICTTHDVTNATLTNNNIITTNPNTLIIANKDQVNNQNNVIVEGAAASLVLAEGYTFNSTTDFTAATLKYAREFSNNWLTVCLPFNYTIPKGVTVETLTEINTGEKTFTFEAISETMKANTPYIIKNSTGTATLFASLSNAEVEATPEAMEVIVDGVGAEFVGTYTTKTSTELMEIANDEAKYDILFFGTDGQLYYLSHGITTKNITFKPFRAYIRVPKGEIDWNDGQQARALHRAPGTTDIDMLESIDNGQQTTVIYDLMGRKVETMEKGGMYIVNGKKVIVK